MYKRQHEVSGNYLDHPDDVVPLALAEMRRIVPRLGETEWVKAKRWGTAEPRRPRTTTHHLGEADIAVCGDGWSQRPRIEAAWRSGRDAATALAARLR